MISLSHHLAPKKKNIFLNALNDTVYERWSAYSKLKRINTTFLDATHGAYKTSACWFKLT